MRKTNIIFLLLFILMTFAPVPLYAVFKEQIGYKNTENKAESGFPELSRDNFSTWPKRFEQWFSDTLPFKTQFIELYRTFQLRNGLDFVQSDVIRGSDDHLFYRKTVENYKGISRFTNEELQLIRQNLEGLFDQAQQIGTKCLLYIAPDKEQVTPSFMPEKIRRVSPESRGEQTAAYLSDTVQFPVIYPKNELSELAKDYPVYYITDTHWNDLGGWFASGEISSAFSGKKADPGMPKYHFYESDGKDLAGMLGLSEQIPEENAVQIDFDDEVLVWKPESIEHGKIQRFGSTSPNQKKLLIIGDSFSEYFMRSAIHDVSEILFVTYGELYRIDIAAEKPDYLVVMLVERNLPFLVSGFY